MIIRGTHFTRLLLVQDYSCLDLPVTISISHLFLSLSFLYLAKKFSTGWKWSPTITHDHSGCYTSVQVDGPTTVRPLCKDGHLWCKGPRVTTRVRTWVDMSDVLWHVHRWYCVRWTVQRTDRQLLHDVSRRCISFGCRVRRTDGRTDERLLHSVTRPCVSSVAHQYTRVPV